VLYTYCKRALVLGSHHIRVSLDITYSTSVKCWYYPDAVYLHKNTHFVFDNFSSLENRTVYEIMWKNIVQPGRPQMAIWRMRIACWKSKATNTHSEYVIQGDPREPDIFKINSTQLFFK